MNKKPNRVFRIRQWKFDYNFRSWRENHKGMRLLYDEERLFDKKMAQLARICDKHNDAKNLSLAIVGEEFIDGEWNIITFHPENFDHKKISS